MSRKTVLNQFVLALYTATCMTTIFQILVKCSLTFAHSEDNCLDPEDNQPLKLELLNVVSQTKFDDDKKNVSNTCVESSTFRAHSSVIADRYQTNN